ncbi:tyrosine--tRNA ligase, mitochondrial-like [Littorina saxatilis]|uniref:Tyrosine--tRNA ligase n=1 Tax=Littorina saxatilis TaxID=31220 RepID=A0AAN9BVG3_9CAEN
MSAPLGPRLQIVQTCARHCVFGARLQRCTRLWLQRLYSTSPNKMLSLHDRGVLQTVFPEGSVPQLSHHLAKPQTVYCGFDPTSDSLHIGNLLAIIALLHCQAAGHTPMALIGGATALIGDPSGKTTERLAMSTQDAESNVLKISENLERVAQNYTTHIIKDSGKQLSPLRILNNMEWYKGKSVVQFLSTVGRHFRMGPMLAKHSVQSRMSSPEGMSFTEFTYQIFQAYDWLHLLQEHQCSIQIGGNDQLGNIVAGYELISKVSKQPVFGLTVPLVTSTTGDKLGKTAGNAVWLDPKKTSAFELYQFFINVADADVVKYLKLFTFLPDQDIASIMTKQQGAPENRVAQKKLAEQVTLLVHGDAGVEQALEWTKALYGGSIEALASLQTTELRQLFNQAPVREMFLEPGMTIMDVCMKAGCFGRPVDAERIIKAGGVYLNHQRVQQPDFVLIPGQHVLSNNTTLIRVGKKNHYIVNWCH